MSKEHVAADQLRTLRLVRRCLRYGCCVLQLLRWNSFLLTHPGFCGAVCCLRGAGDDAMLGKETELQERLATANAFARHH